MFNLPRFLHTLQWDWYSFLRQLKMLTGAFFGIFVFFFFTNGILTMNEGTSHTVALTNNNGLVLIMFFFVLFTAVGSVFQPLYKDRQQLTGYLTLPASNLEKFVSRHLVVVAMMLLSFVVAFVAADVLQYVVGGMMGIKGNALLMTMQRHLWTASAGGVDSVWLSLWSFLYMVSLFVLGGTLFRKTPALCTFLMIMAVGILIGSTFTRSGSDAPGIAVNFGIFHRTTVSIALPLLTIAHILLAYYLFCRTPLISRKLFNF